jgi:hypothetical protein
MTKITPDHLARSAYVYIRQSTADQLLHNAESRRRQYALQERARHLGWADVVWSCPRQTGQVAGWCALMNWRGERIPRARCGCISL